MQRKEHTESFDRYKHGIIKSSLLNANAQETKSIFTNHTNNESFDIGNNSNYRDVTRVYDEQDKTLLSLTLSPN